MRKVSLLLIFAGYLLATPSKACPPVATVQTFAAPMTCPTFSYGSYGFSSFQSFQSYPLMQFGTGAFVPQSPVFLAPSYLPTNQIFLQRGFRGRFFAPRFGSGVSVIVGKADRERACGETLCSNDLDRKTKVVVRGHANAAVAVRVNGGNRAKVKVRR
jgi:hypothetical protein